MALHPARFPAGLYHIDGIDHIALGRLVPLLSRWGFFLPQKLLRKSGFRDFSAAGHIPTVITTANGYGPQFLRIPIRPGIHQFKDPLLEYLVSAFNGLSLSPKLASLSRILQKGNVE